MGVNLHKEVTMTLQLTNQNLGFDENNSSVTNAPRPLARGPDCDIFALRLRECRSETVADSLRISPTTLRRRLSRDSMSYQTILDAVRRYRCEESLADDWVPGKCLAWDLGYAEVNSFYRAFRRWTGRNYSDVKLLLI